MPIEPLNTLPLQQYLQRVKTADGSNAKEVKLSMNEAKDLAFTIGLVMSRMEGDLERLVKESNETATEIIKVEVGSKTGW